MTDEEIQKLADQIRAPIAYTTETLAEALHVSRNKITMWRHVGVIGAIRSGNGWLYPAEEVKRFLNDFLGTDLRNARATDLTMKKIRASR